jgi:hypothetical protein
VMRSRMPKMATYFGTNFRLDTTPVYIMTTPQTAAKMIAFIILIKVV